MSIVHEIMKMVDHSLLGPGLTDEQLREGCETAAKYDTASVCVKPYHVSQAAEYLKDTDVAVGAVIGFPHGNSTTAIKAAEAEQVMADGAVEVDMVVNIGKVLSEDWVYVANEIKTLADLVHNQGAILKVIFENDLLPEDRIIRSSSAKSAAKPARTSSKPLPVTITSKVRMANIVTRAQPCTICS